MNSEPGNVVGLDFYLSGMQTSSHLEAQRAYLITDGQRTTDLASLGFSANVRIPRADQRDAKAKSGPLVIFPRDQVG